MARTSGDARDGQYHGEIPNPVASSGGTTTLYYLFVAKDDDDPAGSCDHTTTSSVFSFRVTAGGGQSVPFCGACSADTQCGASNLCVRLGTSGDAVCLADCAVGQSCPPDSVCAAEPVTSIGGQMRRQCVPQSGVCGVPPPPACQDDSLEDNDSRLSIANPMSHDLPAGDYPGLMICPAGQTDNDEDWYRLDIRGETDVAARIDFDTRMGDLDLALVNGSGEVVRRSYGVGDAESVRQCVTAPGIYYVHVFSFFPPTRNGYSLHLERTPGACCVDDGFEPNDDAEHATGTAPTTGAPFTRQDLAICSGNDDFYAVPLHAGNRLVVDLSFTQSSAQQDLDIHLYDRDGRSDLTPCPPCDTGNGQSANGPEHFERDIAADGTYYVVVRGYEGAANTYAITIAIQ
jgi:hypothetical protein